MAGNIHQYNSPVDKLQPNEEGINAILHAGRSEKESYDEAGRAYGNVVKGVGEKVNDFETMQEISQGSAALAAMHNNLTATWNQAATSADLNDTSIQQKYMDHAKDQLDSWEGAFTTKAGQHWAMEQANSLRDHLWHSTSADMSVRAGEAAVNNMTTTLKNLSESAYKDPSSIDQALDHVDALMEATKENHGGVLSLAQVDKLSGMTDDMKNEIVKAGLKGMAEKNPEAARRAIDTGQFDGYLNTGEAKQMKDYADVQEYGQRMDKQTKAQLKQIQHQQESDKANNSYLSAVTKGDIPLASAIISDPALSTAQKATWVGKNGILSLSPEELHAPSYGDGFDKAVQSIYNGQPFTTDGLLQGIKRGEFTPNGAAQLQQLSAQAKTSEGLAQINAQKQVLSDARNVIVKGGPAMSDPAGQKNYNAFLQSFYQHWDTAIKDGASPAELSNPNSPKYIGGLAQGFKRTDAQALSDVMTATKAQTVPQVAKPTTKQWVVKDGKLVPAGQ